MYQKQAWHQRLMQYVDIFYLLGASKLLQFNYFFKLTLGLKMEGMFIVLIETHDPGNSLHNHNFDFRRIYMVSPQLEFR